MEKRFLQQLTEVIESNFNSPSFGAEELAKKLGISNTTLRRKCSSLTGKSVKQLIIEVRLKKAWDLLQDQSVSASEVAFRTGFGSASYFNTSFKQHFGYPPGEARVRNGGEEREDVMDTGKQHAVPFANNFKRIRGLANSIEALTLLAVGLIFIISSGTFRERDSIAVLPFRNVNQQDSVSGIYTDGFWFQTIISLEKVKGFNVRSAVSSGRYRNTDKTIPEIGKELDVDYILEGSVDKQGDEIKVWVELIQARTDSHRWKDDFRFTLGETWLQLAEIGKFVAYKLSIVLKPKEIEQMAAKCTKSPEAWNIFLQGSWYMGENHTNWDIAIPLFQKAIEVDPTWPDAYIALAGALIKKMKFDPDDEYLVQSKQAIDKAMELRPGADCYSAYAMLYLGQGEIGKARKNIEKAVSMSPDDTGLKFRLANVSRTFGRWKASEKAHEELYSLDTVQPWISNLNFLVLTKELLRKFPEAKDLNNRGIRVQPEWPYFYFGLADIALKSNGDTREARKRIEEMFTIYEWDTDNDNIAQALYYFTLIDIYDGKYEEALFEMNRQFRAILWEPPYYFRPRPFMFATVYGYLNNHGLERAYYDSTRILIEGLQKKSLAARQNPKVNSCLGMAWIGLGNQEKALETAEKVENLLSANPNALSGPYAMEDVAWIYMKTGDYPQSARILNHLLSKPGPLTVKILEIDPRWAPLREKPEFRKLVARYGD